MKFTIRTAAAATTASAAVLLAALAPVATAAEPTPDSSGSYAPEDDVHRELDPGAGAGDPAGRDQHQARGFRRTSRS